MIHPSRRKEAAKITKKSNDKPDLFKSPEPIAHEVKKDTDTLLSHDKRDTQKKEKPLVADDSTKKEATGN